MMMQRVLAKSIAITPNGAFKAVKVPPAVTCQVSSNRSQSSSPWQLAQNAVLRLQKQQQQQQHAGTYLNSIQSYRFYSNCPKDKKVVSVKEAHRFMSDCLKAVCVPEDNANMMATLLSEADHNGHYSHGMNRLEMYIKDIERNVIDGGAKPKVLKETSATAWVDGCNGLGAVVGIICMDLAIKKAKEVGVGWVAAKNSNHYGMQRFYIMMAVKCGLIGFTTTNTSPMMTPTRCAEAVLGTNPLAFGAPAQCDDNFVLDMATTAVAVGKIEIANRKGAKLPRGWAMDSKGKITTDPKEALKAKLLMPLGGDEANSGYKGSGLGAMVEILSGVLAGGNYGKKIKPFQAPTDELYNLGHTFMVLDPERFAPGFRERLSDLNNMIRNCKLVDPKKQAVAPGDVEMARKEQIDDEGGLTYVENQIKTCNALAKRLKVKPLKFN